MQTMLATVNSDECRGTLRLMVLPVFNHARSNFIIKQLLTDKWADLRI